MNRLKIAATSAVLLAGLAAPGADWLTDGGDPQRNNWQKDEKLLSISSVKDLKMLWKIKFDNEVRAMHNLLEPLVIGKVDAGEADQQIGGRHQRAEQMDRLSHQRRPRDGDRRHPIMRARFGKDRKHPEIEGVVGDEEGEGQAEQRGDRRQPRHRHDPR